MKNANQQLICQSLGLTDLDYSTMVFEYSNQWMKRYFFNDEIMIKALEKSPMFWAWWKNQWQIRDEQFITMCSLNQIDEVLEGTCRTVAIELYEAEHDAHKLIVFPNKLVRMEAGREIIKQYETIKKLKSC